MKQPRIFKLASKLFSLAMVIGSFAMAALMLVTPSKAQANSCSAVFQRSDHSKWINEFHKILSLPSQRGAELISRLPQGAVIDFLRRFHELDEVYIPLSRFGGAGFSSRSLDPSLNRHQALRLRKKFEAIRTQYYTADPQSGKRHFLQFPEVRDAARAWLRSDPRLFQILPGDFIDDVVGIRPVDVGTTNLQSRLGEAQWSSGDTGWQTPYENLDRYFREARVSNSSTVVDIGSSFGRSGVIIGTAFPGARYVGYEIVPQRVAVAKEVAEQNNYRKIEFRQQDVSDPSFHLEPADIYYHYYSLNFETFQHVLKQIAQVKQQRDCKLIMRLVPNEYRDAIMETGVFKTVRALDKDTLLFE